MSANEELGLPRGNMKTVRIAFDIDGTIRCNCTDKCTHLNERIYQLMQILKTFKNTELYLWSGGGADYALSIKHRYELPIKDKNCIGKIGAKIKPDIAIDDIQDTALGNINLIVREK